MSDEIAPLEQSPPMTTPEQTKKVPSKGTLERKQYDREAKRRSRERARIEKTQNIRADEYTPPEAWTKPLDGFVSETDRAVRAELGLISTQDEYIIAMVAECSMALDKGYTMTVTEPYGTKAGQYFPEAAAAATVEHVHRYPALLGSGTFKNIYDQLLHAVTKWADKNPRLADEKCIADVKAALNGTYQLPPEPNPVKRAIPTIQPRPPKELTEEEVVEMGRRQLAEQISRNAAQLGMIPADARRYLEG